ncbi:unnamed protein product [Arabidopsis halleri]
MHPQIHNDVGYFFNFEMFYIANKKKKKNNPYLL